MSAYGTVTRLAPAGRHPPKPSHQTKSFMKKTSIRAVVKVDPKAAEAHERNKNPRVRVRDPQSD